MKWRNNMANPKRRLWEEMGNSNFWKPWTFHREIKHWKWRKIKLEDAHGTLMSFVSFKLLKQLNINPTKDQLQLKWFKLNNLHCLDRLQLWIHSKLSFILKQLRNIDVHVWSCGKKIRRCAQDLSPGCNYKRSLDYLSYGVEFSNWSENCEKRKFQSNKILL